MLTNFRDEIFVLSVNVGLSNGVLFEWSSAYGLVNSFRPSATCTRRQTRTSLVQILACRLFGAKPLSEPVLEYCEFDPWEQTSVKFYSKFKNFIEENAFENVVCKMAAILFRGRWVTAVETPNYRCPWQSTERVSQGGHIISPGSMNYPIYTYNILCVAITALLLYVSFGCRIIQKLLL